VNSSIVTKGNENMKTTCRIERMKVFEKECIVRNEWQEFKSGRRRLGGK